MKGHQKIVSDVLNGGCVPCEALKMSAFLNVRASGCSAVIRPSLLYVHSSLYISARNSESSACHQGVSTHRPPRTKLQPDPSLRSHSSPHQSSPQASGHSSTNSRPSPVVRRRHHSQPTRPIPPHPSTPLCFDVCVQGESLHRDPIVAVRIPVCQDDLMHVYAPEISDKWRTTIPVSLLSNSISHLP